jgi:hypothetical protein
MLEIYDENKEKNTWKINPRLKREIFKNLDENFILGLKVTDQTLLKDIFQTPQPFLNIMGSILIENWWYYYNYSELLRYVSYYTKP